jgi:hypothetical protein
MKMGGWLQRQPALEGKKLLVHGYSGYLCALLSDMLLYTPFPFYYRTLHGDSILISVSLTLPK